MYRLSYILAGLIAILAPSLALGQGPAEQAGELRQRATEAYFELSMDDAQRLIDEAIGVCVEGGCSAAETAKLYVVRGVVVHGATSDGAAARTAFRQALALDGSVSIDPMLATPELEVIFDEVRAQAGAGRAGLSPADAAAAAQGDAQDDPRRAVGASCRVDANCREGLTCDAGTCAVPAPVEERGTPYNRFFFELGYSLTSATAHANMTAATRPTLVNPTDDPQTDGLPQNDSYILPGTNGCEAGDGEYCVRVNEGLMAWAHGIHLNFGAYITERAGISARVRLAPNAGGGTLSNAAIGLRGYYRLVVPSLTGFHFAVYGGGMVGQVQVRPKQQPTPPAESVDRPWVRTGLGGLEVGANFGYRFTPNLGVFAAPEIYLMFPDVSLGLQATLGIDVSFGTVNASEPARTPPETAEGDRDRDGIPDSRDLCPDEPEDRDGFEDTDGCPDPDNDGDGIPDARDRCPILAEDFDGFEDTDGCPDPDNDGDGIPDERDRCPNEAGPGENEGCPVSDRDGDGIPDRFDNCPDEPGTREYMGCSAPQMVEIQEDRLQINDMIYFRRNSHVIERRSYALLDNVAQVLVSHPEIAHLRIEGHTDSTGRAEYNRRLSQRRADSVMQYLTRQGHVEAQRLSAHGYGPDQPIHEGATEEEQHAANRRVEFVILSE